MKVAIVVGFFDPVWAELEKRYSAQIAEKTLVLIKPEEPKPIPCIAEIASRISDLCGKAESALILVAQLVGYEWVVAKVEEMATLAEARNVGLDIAVRITKEASDWKWVQSIVGEFGLPQPSSVTMATVRRALGDTKVLCVSMEGRTRLSDALLRAGFPKEAVEQFFVERLIPPAKNSNLISSISAESGQCRHLLYAWDGLRTLPSSVKKQFRGKHYESATAAQVAESFKKWVMKFKEVLEGV